jgi:hypothetical protein
MKKAILFLNWFYRQFEDKQPIKSGTIASFLCEGGMVGKSELKISHTVYPCSNN